MNEMNKGDLFWKCPNCEQLFSAASVRRMGIKGLCTCKTRVYKFVWFELDKGDEPTTEFEKHLATLTKHEVYDMGYNIGVAVSAWCGDEIDAAYQRGHNDGCVESAQLRAIVDTINTVGMGGESSTPATPDDIGEAYDCGYTDGAFAAYPDGYNTGYDKGYQGGKLAGHINGKTEGYARGYTDCKRETHTNVYSAGYADGHRTGSIAGEDEGYEIGYYEAVWGRWYE